MLPFSVLLLSAAVALADQATDIDAPRIDLRIEIDTSTGAFTGSASMEAPTGEIVLPQADWLEIAGLSLGGEALAPARVPSGIIVPGLHRGRDLDMTVAGTLPAPVRPMAAAAWDLEATYSIGPVWFPVDGSTIRDHAVTVVVPEGQRVAGTGHLVSEADGETRFALTGRSADFGLFAGPYEVAEEVRGEISLRTYFEAADEALSARYFEASEAFIARFEREVGAYPYDGFSVVSTPMPVGLGFAGLTYVSRDILDHRYMTGRSLAHEILHSWWGNAVGIDYESGNWAEGLTTFQADYGLAEDQGPETAEAMRVGWIRALASLPQDAQQPLTAFRSASQARDQSEGYGKAAMVFHMLRDELGPDAFYAGSRGFYASARHTVASWGDIQEAFEAASDRDLDWFFDQWLSRAGLPQISVGAEAVSATEDGGAQVTLRFEQTAPTYRLRVPLVFETSAGPVARVAQIEDDVTDIVFSLPERPSAVRLDPRFDLARTPLDGELSPILRELAGHDVTFVGVALEDSTQEAVTDTLAPLTRGASLVWRDTLGAGAAGPVIVVGPPDEVAALRPDSLGPMPVEAGDGRTRIWVERDADGSLWAFLSYADPDDIARDLNTLRFYSGQSYVTAGADGVASFGVWPGAPDRVAVALGSEE